MSRRRVWYARDTTNNEHADKTTMNNAANIVLQSTTYNLKSDNTLDVVFRGQHSNTVVLHEAGEPAGDGIVLLHNAALSTVVEFVAKALAATKHLKHYPVAEARDLLVELYAHDA